MKKIIHIDMDAFFAAVEMRDNPKLKNVPMAIGGPEHQRGVIATANYEARKYGVKSAMPTGLAIKLCPNLIVIKARMSKYKEVSEKIFEIFYKYTNFVEGLSWDEAYLDVTQCEQFNNSATLIAEEIRKQIFDQTGGLTASAGIAPNKLIAKMASDLNKPNGQFTVSPSMIPDFIREVPIERLWGVGKVTTKFMHELHIKKCIDLQRYSQSELIHLFGKFGDTLFDFCRGIDSREVETDYVRKSVGTEETYAQDLTQLSEMKEQILKMSLELKEVLKEYNDKKIKTLNVKIKYFDFKITTIERQMPFDETNFIYLLEERWLQNPRPVRLLGIGVKFEESSSLCQLNLFDELSPLS